MKQEIANINRSLAKLNEENLRDDAAERAVLGCMLLESEQHGNTYLKDLFSEQGMTEAWFAESKNRVVARCIFDMYRKNKAIDLTTVAGELRTRGEMEAAGGANYLTKMSEDAKTTAYGEGYFEQVRDNHIRRELVKKLSEVIAKAYDKENFPDNYVLMRHADDAVLSVDSAGMEVSHAGEAITRVFNSYIKGLETGDVGPAYLETGYPKLDDIIGGLRPAEMIVLAARPSVGKTSLAMNICRNVMEQKHGVLFFSLEMNKEQLITREIAARTGFDKLKYNRREYAQEDAKMQEERTRLIAALKAAQADMEKRPFYLDDTSGATIDRIRTVARRKVRHAQWKEHYVGAETNGEADAKIDLIVIDYLQLITPGKDTRYLNTNEALTEVSAGVKAMAKELKVPVIVLSQLNRASTEKAYGGKGNGGKGKGGVKDVTHDENDGTYEEPMISHLRGSGSIEQDADVVIMLNRTPNDPKEITQEERKIIDNTDCNLMTVRVLKNRNGPRGECRLKFNRRKTLFENLDTSRGNSKVIF